jgi:hypothetical protein
LPVIAKGFATELVLDGVFIVYVDGEADLIQPILADIIRLAVVNAAFLVVGLAHSQADQE